MTVSTSVALHAHRTHVGQQHHGTLPDLLVQAGGGEFLAGDRIRASQGVQPVGGHLADDADTETRPRERLAGNDFLGQTQLPAHRAHLVLEQQPQRLDELELQVVREAADVVMALDVGRAGATTGFHDIGVQRALHQVVDVRLAEGIAHRALERPDELAADDLALALGIRHPGQSFEEPVGDIDGHQLGPGRGDEIALHLRPLPRAQQTVVDEHTREPVPDGALHQRGGHRGVDATGQPADGLAVTDLGADRLDQLLSDVGWGPGRTDPGEFVQEPAQHLLAVRRMQHLGVVLHAGQAAGPVLEARDRGAGAGGDHLEAFRRGRDRVAMAHPHRLAAGQLGMQVATRHVELGAPIFAGPGVFDGAAQHLGHRLEAVANAEHRHVEIEQRRVQAWGALGVDTGRTTRKHDGLRILGLDLLDRGGVRDDLGKHPSLTDPASDQLCVLSAEVDDEDGTG